MWAVIVAVLIIAGLWVGGIYLAFLTLKVKIIGTVLALLFVGSVFLIRRIRAIRAAKALEQELLQQAEQQAAEARPDRRAEILELQGRVKESIAALKKSKLGGGGGAALYALPWYMIVGPPGAGKTTALRHSGLPFPDIGETPSGIKGVGGTRNCDWWFSNEAILLDTAGRYATEEDDREEWTSFLGMLRKHRSHAPINGLLVAVSISDIGWATEEQVESVAKVLRARIDEVITELKMVVPVYVVFTKTDLVAGFVEFFEDMRKSERGQIWGVTFDVNESMPQGPGDAFAYEFENLCSRLHGFALRRIGELRKPESRARVLQFPLEIKSLKSPLTSFVNALFQTNAYQETPLFRGAYFTSGTQEGLPMDRVLGGMAQAFGIQLNTAAGEAVDPKSYFLTDLFQDVIFPDKNLASQTRGEARRRLLLRGALVAAGVVFAAGLCIPGARSFMNNKGLIARADKRARAAAPVNLRSGAAVPQIKRMDGLRMELVGLEEWQKQGIQSGFGWGLYTGDHLYEPMRGEYLALMRDGFALPTREVLLQRMGEIPRNVAMRKEAFTRNYENLKLYLMLTEREHLDPHWAAPKLAAIWAKVLKLPGDTPDQLLQQNAFYYLSHVKVKSQQPLARDQKLVGQVRTELLRVPQVDRLYAKLLADANRQVAPIRHQDIFFGSVAPFVKPKDKNLVVPGAYTKRGWLKVKAFLSEEHKRLVGEMWVLGDKTGHSQADVDRHLKALRRTYFQRYRAAWRKFFENLDVQRPENGRRALEELLALNEPEWPYRRLMNRLRDNVVIDLRTGKTKAKKEGKLTKIIKRGADEIKRNAASKSRLIKKSDLDGIVPLDKRSLMERSFEPLVTFGVPKAPAKKGEAIKPTGLDEYMGILRKLIGVLTDLKASSAEPDPKPLQKAFQKAFRAAAQLLASQTEYTRPLLEPLLMDPITLSWASVVSDAGGAASGMWEVSVWKFCQHKVEGRFPFDAHARSDTKGEDFAKFFKPVSGKVWAFYKKHLDSTLTKEGHNFIPKKKFNTSMGYTPDFLSFLSRTDEIVSATFPTPTSKKPQVAFDVNLHSVSRDISQVRIEVDGVGHTYKNSPEEWLRLQWPAKAAKKRGARIVVRGFSNREEEINRDGDFGFFRLLEAASLRPGRSMDGPNHLAPIIATWRLRTIPNAVVEIGIRPTRADHPFKTGFFNNYRCPRVIANAAR